MKYSLYKTEDEIAEIDIINSLKHPKSFKLFYFIYLPFIKLAITNPIQIGAKIIKTFLYDKASSSNLFLFYKWIKSKIVNMLTNTPIERYKI